MTRADSPERYQGAGCCRARNENGNRRVIRNPRSALRFAAFQPVIDRRNGIDRHERNAVNGCGGNLNRSLGFHQEHYQTHGRKYRSERMGQAVLQVNRL